MKLMACRYIITMSNELIFPRVTAHICRQFSNFDGVRFSEKNLWHPFIYLQSREMGFRFQGAGYISFFGVFYCFYFLGIESKRILNCKMEAL